MSTSSSSSSQASGYDYNPIITSSSTPRPKLQNIPKRRSDRSHKPFTEKMKDRQARNVNPYASSDDSGDEWGAYEANSKYDGYDKPSYETLQKRREAAIILDSPELIMMHAQARCDTIPRTRLYFTKLLAGMEKEEEKFPMTAGYAAAQSSKPEKRDRKSL